MGLSRSRCGVTEPVLPATVIYRTRGSLPMMWWPAVPDRFSDPGGRLRRVSGDCLPMWLSRERARCAHEGYGRPGTPLGGTPSRLSLVAFGRLGRLPRDALSRRHDFAAPCDDLLLRGSGRRAGEVGDVCDASQPRSCPEPPRPPSRWHWFPHPLAGPGSFSRGAIPAAVRCSRWAVVVLLSLDHLQIVGITHQLPSAAPPDTAADVRSPGAARSGGGRTGGGR